MPDELRLICCPFHNGRLDVAMGAGARRLSQDRELIAGIQKSGWDVTHAQVDHVDEGLPEIARSMQIIRSLRGQVRAAVDAGAVPFVLAGNCNSSLGTIAGVGARDLGVVWLDAHADFDDPEENLSGFFDVMGLAMVTGRGWTALRQTIPGHEPIPEANVILGAVRDLEPYQRETLNGANVLTVPDVLDPKTFEGALQALSGRVARVYLHVDLDSLDIDEARANEYAAAGGPTIERILACIRQVCEAATVEAAAITAYDPSYDEGDRAIAAARMISAEIAAAVKPTKSLR